MAFAARIVAGVTDMLVALVLQVEPGGRKRGSQPLDHFPGDGSGGGISVAMGAWSYIEGFEERGSKWRHGRPSGTDG